MSCLQGFTLYVGDGAVFMKHKRLALKDRIWGDLQLSGGNDAGKLAATRDGHAARRHQRAEHPARDMNRRGLQFAGKSASGLDNNIAAGINPCPTGQIGMTIFSK
jgi:hypothetical protein